MTAKTPYLHSCSTIRATSPNHEGGEGTDSEEVWIITDPSAIVFMCASLMESVLFFLITEAHFYPGSLQVTSRCAIRGHFGGLWSERVRLRRAFVVVVFSVVMFLLQASSLLLVSHNSKLDRIKQKRLLWLLPLI